MQCDDLGFEASQSGHLLGVAFLLIRFDPTTRNFTVSLQKIKFLTEEFHRFGLFMRYSEILRKLIFSRNLNFLCKNLQSGNIQISLVCEYL